MTDLLAACSVNWQRRNATANALALAAQHDGIGEALRCASARQTGEARTGVA